MVQRHKYPNNFAAYSSRARIKIDVPAPTLLFRRRPANDLDEPVGTNPFCEGGANLIGAHRKVLLRSAQRFIEWQTHLSAGKHSSGHAIFARFRERNLPQKKRLGLLELGWRDIFFLHRNQV